MATQKRSATVKLTIVAVIIMSGLVGCRGNSTEALARGIDEIAGRAAAQVAERNMQAAGMKLLIEGRVQRALSAVKDLPAEERQKLIERACTAKDLYDLRDPVKRIQLVTDYKRFGPHGAEYAGLLRDFGELAGNPSLGDGVDVTVSTVCTAAGEEGG